MPSSIDPKQHTGIASGLPWLTIIEAIATSASSPIFAANAGTAERAARPAHTLEAMDLLDIDCGRQRRWWRRRLPL